MKKKTPNKKKKNPHTQTRFYKLHPSHPPTTSHCKKNDEDEDEDEDRNLFDRNPRGGGDFHGGGGGGGGDRELLRRARGRLGVLRLAGVLRGAPPLRGGGEGAAAPRRGGPRHRRRRAPGEPRPGLRLRRPRHRELRFRGASPIFFLFFFRFFEEIYWLRI